MKVWLDDERMAPTGWVHVKTPEAAILLLESGRVEEISLDHDLGLLGENESTGYDVLLWIEREVALRGFIPPKMHIHTANPVAYRKMRLAIEKIHALAKV